MTASPDHRALHPPHEQCEGCQPPSATSAVGHDVSAASAAAVPPVRSDLVFHPGSNRK